MDKKELNSRVENILKNRGESTSKQPSSKDIKPKTTLLRESKDILNEYELYSNKTHKEKK